MTLAAIFISPGENGYEFSGGNGRINARLLALMTPNPGDLVEEGVVSPFIRADWAAKEWLLPRSEILLMVGLRVSVSGTPSHRGSNSIWAASTLLKVRRSPTPAKIRSELAQLADSFIAALSGDSADEFTNKSHTTLAQLLRPADLESSVQRIREIIKSGHIPSPFFK